VINGNIHFSTKMYIPSMSRKPKGSRLLQLGVERELVDRFTDFREGYFGAPENRILAEAMPWQLSHQKAIASPSRRALGLSDSRDGMISTVVGLSGDTRVTVTRSASSTRS
jgi:hypothetical protein